MSDLIKKKATAGKLIQLHAWKKFASPVTEEEQAYSDRLVRIATTLDTIDGLMKRLKVEAAKQEVAGD